MLPANNEKEDSSNLVDEKAKQLQDETLGDSQKKPSTIIDSIPSQPKLLAWSSNRDNKISIVEIETQQEFADFDGVQLINKNANPHWTHVKEIANTGFLVSVHHSPSMSANLEVFGVSQKEKIQKIYQATEVSGITGYGDVTYNPRRNFLGAMNVAGKVAYQLYNFDTLKSDDTFTLIRKSSWHPQYSTEEDNFIAGLNFNPNGEIAAAIDLYGVCLISDVNTGSYRFHLNMEMNLNWDPCARCRWSSNPDEPLLFVKYDRRLLNILDTEKKALLLKNPIQIDSKNETHWIDICQSNGSMLAAGGRDSTIKIFDKRESNIVQTFDGIHTKDINCVRWSPTGDMLASASDDKTVALLDFKTWKKLYTGKTSDEMPAMSVCFI